MIALIVCWKPLSHVLAMKADSSAEAQPGGSGEGLAQTEPESAPSGTETYRTQAGLPRENRPAPPAYS